MNSTQLWIVGGVGFYMLGMLGIGFWASTRIKNTKDYIVAGGRLGWWLSIGTLFATWFGAETCMGSSGTAFNKGVLGVIADPFGAGLCLIIAGFFFARFFRRRGYETIVDFFEDRFGKRTASFLSLVYLPVYLGWVGAQLLAFGLILNSLIGLSLVTSVCISTAVVLIYTYSGGMWADTVTDFFQMIIIIFGLLILFPILLFDLGGIGAISTKIPSDFFHFYPHNASGLSWLNYIQAWMLVGIGSLPAQDLFQRMMAPKDENVSSKSAIIAGFLYISLGMLPVLLGIFGRLVITEGSGEAVLIDLSLRYLPAPLIALLVGALLSAIMSSADSALLAPASIIGKNIVTYFRPNISEEQKLKWCKLSVPLIGLASLFLAIYFQNVYALCQEAWGILLVGVAAPMIFGVYWKKANPQGALAGGICGTAAWIMSRLMLPADYPHNLLGFIVSCLALVVVSVLTQKGRTEIIFRSYAPGRQASLSNTAPSATPRRF